MDRHRCARPQRPVARLADLDMAPCGSCCPCDSQPIATRLQGEVGAPHVQIAATNNGRGQTTVTSWGLRMPDGNDMTVLYQLPWSSPLPFAIPPGGAAGTWFLETDKAQDACQRAGLDHRQLQAWVRLSDGRQVLAKQRGIGIE